MLCYVIFIFDSVLKGCGILLSFNISSYRLLYMYVILTFLLRDNGPQIAYVRDFKAKVQYFRFWCQVSFRTFLYPLFFVTLLTLHSDCENN